MITCNSCFDSVELVFNFNSDSVCLHKLHKCKCKLSIFYSKYPISPQVVASQLGHYLKEFCPECKGEGVISVDSFEWCSNCKGSGGVTCSKCKQQGYLLYERDVYCGNGVHVPCLKKQPCSCNNGFTTICRVCGGSKSQVSGKVSAKCPSCVSTFINEVKEIKEIKE